MAFSLASSRVAAPQKVAAAASFKGDVRPLAARPAAAVALRAARFTVSASDAAAPAAAAPAVFVPPPLDPNTPSPIFGGSTGGLLRKAQVRTQGGAGGGGGAARRAESRLRALGSRAGAVRIAPAARRAREARRARAACATARGVAWNGAAPRAGARRGRGAARRRIFRGPTTFSHPLRARARGPGSDAHVRRWPAAPPAAQVEEFYVITWTAKKEQIFEMPVRSPTASAPKSLLALFGRGAFCAFVFLRPGGFSLRRRAL
jgi:hypothetical protein